MWNKFMEWHKKTWNDGGVGKGKIIGIWFVVLMVLTVVGGEKNTTNDSGVQNQSASSGDLEDERLKKECEAIGQRGDSDVIVRKNVNDFVQDHYKKKFKRVLHVSSFSDISVAGSSYFGNMHFGHQTIQIEIPEAYIRMVSKTSKKGFQVKVSGYASQELCVVDSNGKTIFNRNELISLFRPKKYIEILEIYE